MQHSERHGGRRGPAGHASASVPCATDLSRSILLPGRCADPQEQPALDTLYFVVARPGSQPSGTTGAAKGAAKGRHGAAGANGAKAAAAAPGRAASMEPPASEDNQQEDHAARVRGPAATAHCALWSARSSLPLRCQGLVLLEQAAWHGVKRCGQLDGLPFPCLQGMLGSASSAGRGSLDGAVARTLSPYGLHRPEQLRDVQLGPMLGR